VALLVDLDVVVPMRVVVAVTETLSAVDYG